LDSETAQKVSAELLNELEMKAEEVDKLQKLSYYDLITAGNKAVAAVRKEARSKGESISGSILGPVHDNYFLPYNLFTPEALELSKNVSIMIGTTKNEFSAGAAARTGEDMEATIARVKEMYSENADAYMEAVKNAYPNTLKASDYLAIDFMFRPGAMRDANTLVNAGHGNTYMYLFSWQSPVDDGSLKSMHCMELPFVFNNIRLGKELTGGGKEAYDLAETVSGAWINFARTGNPNTEGIPSWPKYTFEEGATMIIDTESEVKFHHDKELLKIVKSDQLD
jgi:para-nitrobenzyl esterase